MLKVGNAGKRTNFPLQFQKVLILKGSSYTHLAKALERRGYKVSRQFLCQVGIGNRAVPALLLGRICETLGCDPDERKELSVAACRDAGFFV